MEGDEMEALGKKKQQSAGDGRATLSRVLSINLIEMLKSGQKFEGSEVRNIPKIHVERAFHEKGDTKSIPSMFKGQQGGQCRQKRMSKQTCGNEVMTLAFTQSQMWTHWMTLSYNLKRSSHCCTVIL